MLPSVTSKVTAEHVLARCSVITGSDSPLDVALLLKSTHVLPVPSTSSRVLGKKKRNNNVLLLHPYNNTVDDRVSGLLVEWPDNHDFTPYLSP